MFPGTRISDIFLNDFMIISDHFYEVRSWITGFIKSMMLLDDLDYIRYQRCVIKKMSSPSDNII
jgi:hypothetical protein